MSKVAQGGGGGGWRAPPSWRAGRTPPSGRAGAFKFQIESDVNLKSLKEELNLDLVLCWFCI